ncbi:MAG: hypothetical protein A2284_07940 [Deltaproteobacteria bacterium RIFOXYA12_FULL_61_11]|nr:MAG: hypothetical protein A2284_07940 [Deltaproteobacteria bacterium RIFOXYA12_FULL_61_11]
MKERGSWRIALVSAAILCLELAFIRLVPAEVRVISYFTNLLLIAAFFGLGLGCILQGARSVALCFPLGLSLVLGFVLLGRGLVFHDAAAEVHYWIQYKNLGRLAPDLPLFPAAAAILCCAALPFVALGQTLARLMARQARLPAYGWDLLGSLLGTILFSLSASVWLPPWLWPPLCALAWIAAAKPGFRIGSAALLAGLAFTVLAHSDHPAVWSPYYLVQHRQEPGGLRVWVNASFHQYALDFDATSDKASNPVEALVRKWEIPYRIAKRMQPGHFAPRVLVLGAGTGNDVEVALRNGASEVVAVEIDPAILELGRTLAPGKPYADPRVRAVVDDARHFLRSEEGRYDLVVFGTLDSQTLLQHQANLRLESYVYTTEALLDARRILARDGLLVVYYSVFKPWLWDRLLATVRSAFGVSTRLYRTEDQRLFNTIILAADPENAAFAALPEGIPLAEEVGATTDDWPFVYLSRPTIAPLYGQLFLLVLGLLAAALLLLRRVSPGRGWCPDLLFLGVGFTLLEAAAIVRLALVFGNTWTVNAVVVGAVLATMSVANLGVQLGSKVSPGIVWSALILAVLLNYFFPLNWLLALPASGRVLVCVPLLGAPVFCAAWAFSQRFVLRESPGYALGLNLIGAMAGGTLEYVSMLIGLRAVWLLVLAVYLAAWLGALIEDRRSASAAR